MSEKLSRTPKKKRSDALLKHLGEFGLISRISNLFPVDEPGVIGIGDDAAVIQISPDRALLLSTDLMVEDVHFLKHRVSPEDLAYKLLTVNISDIAAKGGTPRYALLSLACKPTEEVAWLDKFFKSFATECKGAGVLLLGGNTSQAPREMSLGLTLIGEIHPSHLKLRSAARPGDVICVNSTLGDSAAGLRMVLSRGTPKDRDSRVLMERHYRPARHLSEARWLATRQEVHAMMDLSDGLASDLPHILERSLCGATVALERLPLSKEMSRAAQRSGWDALELAATGGEDYGLLLTVKGDAYAALAKEYFHLFKHKLFQIGSITSTAGQLEWTRDGRPSGLLLQGYAHFR